MESGNTTKIPKSGDNLLPETTKHVGNVTFVVRLHDKAHGDKLNEQCKAGDFQEKITRRPYSFTAQATI